MSFLIIVLASHSNFFAASYHLNCYLPHLMVRSEMFLLESCCDSGLVAYVIINLMRKLLLHMDSIII